MKKDLFCIAESGGGRKRSKVFADGRREFFYWVWLFFVLSVFGWLWEVCLYLVKDGTFVNRGILTGPWLPVYGFGGVALALVLGRFSKRPLTAFALSLALGTVIEYLAGWYLEERWGAKWWDYSGAVWNLQGRVCFASSMLFGIAGMILVCAAVPIYTMLIRKVPDKLQAGLGILFLVLFAADAAHSAILPHMGAGVAYR